MNPLPVFAIAALLGRNPVLVCAVAGEAERRGIDPVVVVALVEHESNFCPWAQSATRDYGLMQIHEPIHGRHREPAANIRKGVEILSHGLERERGDMRRALSRYNTGRVGRRGLAYADAVLSRAEKVRKALAEKVGTPWRDACTIGQMDRLYGFAFEWAPRREE